MTDLENSTVPVKWFVRAMWAMGGLLVVGALTWGDVQHTLSDHTRAIQESADVAKETKAEIGAKLNVLIDGQSAMQTQMATADRKAQSALDRIDSYRPYKWSTPMMLDYGNQLQQLNPSIKVPDAQKVHNDNLPYTP